MNPQAGHHCGVANIYMTRVVNYALIEHFSAGVKHDNRHMMIVTSNPNVYSTGHRSLNKFNKLKEKKFQKMDL